MSDCRTATNGADKVRKLQRALYRTSKQDKKKRFYSLYDKVWRADVLWEAWRQVKANKGAPGVDGMAIETIINTGQEEAMITKLHKAETVLAGKKVLLVDDDVRNIFAMTSVLERFQMNVIPAETGQTALKLLAAACPPSGRARRQDWCVGRSTAR